MDLITYISDMPRRAALAEACGASPDYLWQIATAWNGRRASTELAQAIDRESARLGPERVPKELLRPDVWKSEAPEAHPPVRRSKAVEGEAAATDGDSVSDLSEAA